MGFILGMQGQFTIKDCIIRHITSKDHVRKTSLSDAAATAAKSLQSCPTLRNPHRRQHTRPRCLGFSSKTTGVGCHFLLQCMKVKSERSRHSVQSMTKAAWEYSTQVLLERKQEERRSKERKDRLVEGPHYKSSI